uniref:Uncharacterized protein n=1 Tax=Anopheles atroparvus TaxID=41427 RepID=A0A182JAN3_ANOAO
MAMRGDSASTLHATKSGTDADRYAEWSVFSSTCAKRTDDLLLRDRLARLDAAPDAEEVAVQGGVAERAQLGGPGSPEGGALQERFLAQPDVLGRLVEVDARVLRLERGEPVLDRVAEQLREGTVLHAQPGVVLEQELLEAGPRGVLVDVVFKLRDRVLRGVKAEEQLAHLVVDEAGDRLYLQAVRVDDPQIVQEGVRLPVVPQRVRLVQFQLGDEAQLELHRVRVGQLVPVEADLFHHLRVVGLGQLEEGRLQPEDVPHQVVVVWKHEEHFRVDVAVAGQLSGPLRGQHVLALQQMIAPLQERDGDARVAPLERVFQHLYRGGTLQLLFRPLWVVPLEILKEDDHRRQDVQSTTNRLSQEYRSWSSSLLPSKLLASPTLSGDGECQASQYVSMARSPSALEPCHTSFCGLQEEQEEELIKFY